ncbi:M56 family peptidase [Candidatus Microgenomates bacterium]|nr:MAG: M56 family peptidase [Candidatus Microgenomates bacterium]
MKSRQILPIVFIATSGLVFILGTYLLVTKTTLHPQLFITACGEILKNIREHVHFNTDGFLSSLILFVTAISVGLALFQLIKFIVSHWRLHQFQPEGVLPDNLRAIISKHDLSNEFVSVVRNTKLTAYTIGLLRPKIIVSKALTVKLSQNQLEAVVLHELYHLRNHHVLWLLLSRLISSLFFFIPLIEYFARQLKTEFELAADAFVVEKQKTKDHLCGSLALNIQYAGSVIPHFATSPIEKRVESLIGNKITLEKIGTRQLSVSLLSIGLMMGAAVIQPGQVSAGLTLESNAICRVGEKCQTTDCTSHQSIEPHNFTPHVPVSFSFSSSH